MILDCSAFILNTTFLQYHWQARAGWALGEQEQMTCIGPMVGAVKARRMGREPQIPGSLAEQVCFLLSLKGQLEDWEEEKGEMERWWVWGLVSSPAKL